MTTTETKTKTARYNELAEETPKMLRQMAAEMGVKVDKGAKVGELVDAIIAHELKNGDLVDDTAVVETAPAAEVVVAATPTPWVVEDETPKFWGAPRSGFHIVALILLANEIVPEAPVTSSSDANVVLETFAAENDNGEAFSDRFQPRFGELYTGLLADLSSIEEGGVFAEKAALATAEWDKLMSQVSPAVAAAAAAPKKGGGRKGSGEARPVVSALPVPEAWAAKGVQKIPPMNTKSVCKAYVAVAFLTTKHGEGALANPTPDITGEYVELFCTWSQDRNVWEAFVKTPEGKASLGAWDALVAGRAYWANGSQGGPRVPLAQAPTKVVATPAA